MPPLTQRFTCAGDVGHAAQEGRWRETFVRQRERDVIPKLRQIFRRFRPQRDGIHALDRPLRMQTNHVLVKNFAREPHALVALFHLAQIILLIRRERAAEFRREVVLEVFFLHRRLWQRATRVAPLHRHQAGAQGEIFQRLIAIDIGLAMPAMIAPQPAHLGGTLVETHLRHHFIFQHVDADDRIIIHESLGLLAHAFIKLQKQGGNGVGQGRHAWRSGPQRSAAGEPEC